MEIAFAAVLGYLLVHIIYTLEAILSELKKLNKDK